jgi:hypothetical protein
MLYPFNNSSSETPSPFSLIGPKLNCSLVKIEGDLKATKWTAFVAATFQGTRLDQGGAEVIADTLEERIARDLDLAVGEVMVTTTCPCCFQISIETSDPRVVAWIQGQEESNPVGLLIDCIQNFWINFGCFDGPSPEEPCDECAFEKTHARKGAPSNRRKPSKGPVLDV